MTHHQMTVTYEGLDVRCRIQPNVAEPKAGYNVTGRAGASAVHLVLESS